MQITAQRLELLRTKIVGLIQQVLEEEGVEHSFVTIDVHGIKADLHAAHDRGEFYSVHAGRFPDTQLTLFKSK